MACHYYLLCICLINELISKSKGEISLFNFPFCKLLFSTLRIFHTPHSAHLIFHLTHILSFLLFIVLLVFSVTPFKIDENKNQNHSIDKIQDLENERRYKCKDPRQDSGQRNVSYTRYPKKCFTQIYRDLYRDAMLVLTWMSSNMADGNQQKHLLPSFATKA